MRTITLLTVMLLASSLAASGQSGSGGDSTAPHNRGSTGWTGAHPETGGASLDQGANKGKPADATTGQTVYDEAEAKDQPAIATGQDLKGPARQLPPSKTPE